MSTVVTDPVAVANQLRPLLHKLTRHLRRETHSLGVTGSQISLLAEIRRAPGIGVRELAALELMSSPGMSKYVARLERAGLVRRTETTDRRRVGRELTEGAQSAPRPVRSRRPAWLAARLNTLDPDELAAVDAAIEPLSRLLEERA